MFGPLPKINLPKNVLFIRGVSDVVCHVPFLFFKNQSSAHQGT